MTGERDLDKMGSTRRLLALTGEVLVWCRYLGFHVEKHGADNVVNATVALADLSHIWPKLIAERPESIDWQLAASDIQETAEADHGVFWRQTSRPRLNADTKYFLGIETRSAPICGDRA